MDLNSGLREGKRIGSHPGLVRLGTSFSVLLVLVVVVVLVIDPNDDPNRSSSWLLPKKRHASTTLSVVILFEEGIEYQAELLEITAMAADKLGGVGEITFNHEPAVTIEFILACACEKYF